MNSVSIITINFNNRDHLERTIKSVLSQKNCRYEFIIIDGGSNDGSIEVIKKYESHISYWISEIDTGIYDAQNKGIKVATSQYLHFLNSGDYYVDENVLSRFLETEHCADIVYGNYKLENKSKSYIQKSSLRFSDFWYKSVISHQTAFIKKELFDKYGLYDSTLKIAADWKFFLLCIFRYNCTYFYINTDIVFTDSSGISSTADGFILANTEREVVFNKFFPGLIKDYTQLSEFHFHWMYRFTRKIHLCLKRIKTLFVGTY